MTAAGMTQAKVLVMAKAPVAGLAKTRLGAVLGYGAAADLAAAGLLDTLEACAGAGTRIIAMTGELDDAMRSGEIREALHGWTVVQQRGITFGARLANAHVDAGPGPVIQIGMDTPQVSAEDLLSVASALRTHDAVIGDADDGGWWVLGRHDADDAQALIDVVMSTAHTGVDTRAALRARGLSVGSAVPLRDVDTVQDAEIVSASAPHTRFARAWATASISGSSISRTTSNPPPYNAANIVP